MRSARRALVWMAMIGLAITLVILLQRRGNDRVAADTAGSTQGSIEASRTTRKIAAVSESAASNADVANEADARCAQTVSDAADFAMLEAKAANPGWNPESGGNQHEATKAAALRSMADSRDPEQFLTLFLLDSSAEEALNAAAVQARLLALGDRAVASGSKVLAWHALRVCAGAGQCPMTHLEQRLLELDRQNAEAWGLVATLRYERGDVAGALTAMQGAARAPTSTWYFTETNALIERALAAQSTMPYADRMGEATFQAQFAVPSYALPFVPSLSDVKMCKAEFASSRAWGEACLAFGTLRAKRNEMDEARSVAYSLRELALTALGNREGAAEAAAEVEQARAEHFQSGDEEEGASSSMRRLQGSLMATGPSRLQAYLAAFRQYGEGAGDRMFLRQEVPPLLERAGLLKREGVRECVARFFVGFRRPTAGQQAQIADELHISLRSRATGGKTKLRISPDGTITLPWVPRTEAASGTVAQPDRKIVAAGKTTAQLQSEIITIYSRYDHSPEVSVTLFPSPSSEDLRSEFDDARREAAATRSKLR